MELFHGEPAEARSRLADTLEEQMLLHPEHWRGYYRGDEREQRLARRYGLSDRCRYYWALPPLQRASSLLDRPRAKKASASDVSAPLDGQAAAGFVYNAAVVDGRFGLFTSNGNSSFDSATIRTDDPAFAQAPEPEGLTASSGSPQPPTVSTLSYASLGPVLSEAVDRLAASTATEGNVEDMTY